MLKGKLMISGAIECLTGLHIGGCGDVTSIGGVDNLVVREPLSNEPYIPGSSLKGKLRSLVEKYHYAREKDFDFDKSMNVGEGIRYHECGRKECPVCRLFGSSPANASESRPARLVVRDAWLTEKSLEDLSDMDSGYYLTEVKFENTLDRVTCAANPRQNERVPRGSIFRFEMVYTLLDKEDCGLEAMADLEELFRALCLLQDDYLGGNGSRGYGQIHFQELKAVWKALDYFSFLKDGIDIQTVEAESACEGKELKPFGEGMMTWLQSRI